SSRSTSSSRSSGSKRASWSSAAAPRSQAATNALRADSDQPLAGAPHHRVARAHPPPPARGPPAQAPRPRAVPVLRLKRLATEVAVAVAHRLRLTGGAGGEDDQGGGGARGGARGG